MESWHGYLLDLLTKPNTSLAEAKKVRPLITEHLPEKLYRHSRVDQYSLSNLKNNTVWMSSPISFNDPFDSAFRINMQQDITGKVLDNLFSQGLLDQESLKKCGSSQSPLKRASLSIILNDSSSEVDSTKAADALSEAFNTAIQQVELRHIQELKDGLKVGCFGTNPFNSVMWSHYSNSHSGFCVEWPLSNLPSDNPLKNSIFPVIYTDELLDMYPHVQRNSKGSSYNPAFLTAASLIKHTDWAYEQEWRIVFPMGKQEEEYAYPIPVSPTAIYLGLNIDKQNEVLIGEIASYLNIPVRKLRISHEKFSLEIDDF